jgi:hypothetical protein
MILRRNSMQINRGPNDQVGMDWEWTAKGVSRLVAHDISGGTFTYHGLAKRATFYARIPPWKGDGT